MGTLVREVLLKAANDTCPPLGNADDEAMGPAPKALLPAADAVAPVLALVEAAAAAAALAEDAPPVAVVPEDPPETTPDEAALPVRMNRSRRSCGLLWKMGSTSSTTWYWFNCVNMVETRRCP